jgi:hypothetical protein
MLPKNISKQFIRWTKKKNASGKLALVYFRIAVASCIFLYVHPLQGQTQLTKEYIYLGERLIATEKTQAPECTYGISPATQTIGSSASSNLTFQVSASNPSCTWSSVTSDGWIHTASSGTGNGTVSYSVDANTGAARTGQILVGASIFSVTQANGCTYSISPNHQSFGAGGGSGNLINVYSGNGCSWTAGSSAAWILIDIPSNGHGTSNGTVSYTVQPNTGIARSGTITIAGQIFTIDQANGCTYSVSPTFRQFTYMGGTGVVNVTTGSSCPWTATKSSWINIQSGSSGTGSGPINYSVPRNYGNARSGYITVQGRQSFIMQDGKPGGTYAPQSDTVDTEPEE